VKELCESDGWRALEARGENWSVRRAAFVVTGQRSEQAQGRDDSSKEKRQKRNPIRATGMTVWNQHQHKGKADCDHRNQEPRAPMSILYHHGTSVVWDYIGSPDAPSLRRFCFCRKNRIPATPEQSASNKLN
jgi:hypothetical protein